MKKIKKKVRTAENPNLNIGEVISGDLTVKVNELSFIQERPFCCNEYMYATGGTLGVITKDSFRTWRCDVCKKEIMDLPS